MHVPIPYIPRIKPTKKCQRCALRYPKKLNQCSPYHTLSDQELTLFPITSTYRYSMSRGDILAINILTKPVTL